MQSPPLSNNRPANKQVSGQHTSAKRISAKRTSTRRSAIIAHLQQHGRVSVDQLAELYNTTAQTIRKDLSVLEENQKIIRFHGGASLIVGATYTRFEVRQQVAQAEKQKIGHAIAKLIPNNASVIINSGTTTLAFARQLCYHTGLKVITDSVLLAGEIREFAGLEIIVPSGTIRPSDGVILGETTVDFMRGFHADFAVISAAAMTKEGVFLDYDFHEVSLVQAIIRNSRHVILALDSSKFDRSAPFSVGDLSHVHRIVTDKNCPAALDELCQLHKITLNIIE